MDQCYTILFLVYVNCVSDRVDVEPAKNRFSAGVLDLLIGRDIEFGHKGVHFGKVCEERVDSFRAGTVKQQVVDNNSGDSCDVIVKDAAQFGGHNTRPSRQLLVAEHTGGLLKKGDVTAANFDVIVTLEAGV